MCLIVLAQYFTCSLFSRWNSVITSMSSETEGLIIKKAERYLNGYAKQWQHIHTYHIQCRLWSCIFTQSQGYLIPSRFDCFWLFRLPLCSGSIFTQITGISDPFMLWLFVIIQATLVEWQHIHTNHRDIWSLHVWLKNTAQYIYFFCNLIVGWLSEVLGSQGVECVPIYFLGNFLRSGP